MCTHALTEMFKYSLIMIWYFEKDKKKKIKKKKKRGGVLNFHFGTSVDFSRFCSFEVPIFIFKNILNEWGP